MHVLLLQSGGMRGADTAGFILGAGLEPCWFSGVVANSSGAANAAFFATSQFGEFEPCWTKRMPTPRFIGLSNLLRSGTLLDMDYVRREVFGHLDLGALEASATAVQVGVLRLSEGTEVYIKLTRQNAVELLAATCSLPFVTRAVRLAYNGCGPEPMKDGAIVNLLPMDKALQLAAQTGGKVLVVTTRPEGWRFSGYGPIEMRLARLLYSRAYSAFRERGSRYDDALRLARTEDGRVMVCYPEEEPKGGRFHTDPAIALHNFERGRARGRDAVPRIRAFLGI